MLEGVEKFLTRRAKLNHSRSVSDYWSGTASFWNFAKSVPKKFFERIANFEGKAKHFLPRVKMSSTPNRKRLKPAVEDRVGQKLSSSILGLKLSTPDGETFDNEEVESRVRN